MVHLLEAEPPGSSVSLAVLGCSQGAEVYSITWTLRSARPDLKLTIHAVDISPAVLEFAERGVYSLEPRDAPNGAARRFPDQDVPIVARMTAAEIEAMFEVHDGTLTVRPWLKEGITWYLADAGRPDLLTMLGLHDVVVANRFLCHMDPAAAERCLRNLARIVKPGGYLFVSGVDLDVRTGVAREMEWEPVTSLLREMHEGDPSLRRDWPLQYWGLEPLAHHRRDWTLRYASAFRIGEATHA